MGAYMATPSTEKVTGFGHTEWLTYGVSSMQGWRVQQEDAHNCVPDFDTARHASLFAVYDGHGGAEVARYCAAYLPDFLRKLPAYSNSDPADALKQLFLDFDASLITPETRSILRSLAKSNEDDPSDGIEDGDDSEEEESDSDINALRAEAEQPLESVLQRYGGEDALPSSVKELLDRRKQVGECSQGTSSSRERKQSNSETESSEAARSSNSSGQSETPPNNGTEEPISSESKSASSSSPAHPASTEDPRSDKESNSDDDDEDDSEDETIELEDEDEGDEDEGESDEDEEETDSSSDDSDEDEDVEDLGLQLPSVLKGQDDSEPGVDSGTTACVALLLPLNGVVKLFVANAGDSRAVLCRGAAAVELSVDHKPDDEDEKSRIVAAGGTVTRDGRVNGGLNLSRALGDHCYKQSANLPLAEQMITPLPDVIQFDLIPGADDFLVIACDGVWNSMSSQEVVSFVYDRLHPTSVCSADNETTYPDPDEEALQLSRICGELFDHCLAPNTDGDGTGCDNMTCIIVRFHNLDDLAKLSASSADHNSSIETCDQRKRAAIRIDLSNGVVTNGSEPLTPKRLRTDLDVALTSLSNGESVE